MNQVRAITTILGSCLLSLGLAVSCEVQASSAAQAPSISKMTGSQLLTTTMAAATKAKSCTNISTSVSDGHTFVLRSNSGPISGEQFLSYQSAKSDVREVGGDVYFNENSAGLKLQFDVKNPKLANKWIEVTSSNVNFANFEEGILISSVLTEIPPSGSLSTTKVEVIHGEKVIGITGKPNETLGVSTGTETLYVSTTAPFLPVELTVSGTSQGVADKFVVTLTNWGKSFHILKPANPLPISKTNLPS